MLRRPVFRGTTWHSNSRVDNPHSGLSSYEQHGEDYGRVAALKKKVCDCDNFIHAAVGRLGQARLEIWHLNESPPWLIMSLTGNRRWEELKLYSTHCGNSQKDFRVRHSIPLQLDAPCFLKWLWSLGQRRLEKAVSGYHNVLARKEVIWSFGSRAPKNYLVWVEYSYGINPYDLAA